MTKTRKSLPFTKRGLGAVLALLSLIVGTSLHAQQSELSPYSRYGFGLIGQLNAPAYAGLGGMETTLLNSYQFQHNNPANGPETR